MNLRARLMVALLVTLATSTLATAQVTFTFNFLDQNTGFNDPNLGSLRRTALETAGETVASYFGAYTAEILMDVQGDLTDDGVLGSASSNYNAAYPGPGFNDLGDVALKILNGNQADPAPNASDGLVSFNFEDNNWEYGDDFQFGEFDFISTAMHELMHSVGFLTSIEEDGSDLWGSRRGGPSTWGPFDEYIGDASGPMIDDSYSLQLVRWATASKGGSGDDGLFFFGPNAMLANGNNPVAMYSPLSFDAGSSASHLDDATFGGQMLMESTAASGRGVRELSQLELGILQDIGFAAITVPEPTTMGLMLFSIAGLVLRRRR